MVSRISRSPCPVTRCLQRLAFIVAIRAIGPLLKRIEVSGKPDIRARIAGNAAGSKPVAVKVEQAIRIALTHCRLCPFSGPRTTLRRQIHTVGIHRDSGVPAIEPVKKPFSLTFDNGSIAIKMNNIAVTHIDTAVCGKAKSSSHCTIPP